MWCEFEVRFAVVWIGRAWAEVAYSGGTAKTDGTCPGQQLAPRLPGSRVLRYRVP